MTTRSGTSSASSPTGSQPRRRRGPDPADLRARAASLGALRPRAGERRHLADLDRPQPADRPLPPRSLRPAQESIDEQSADRLPAAGGTDEPELDIAPDLAEALERLGQRERELIALRYGADMTGPEIAELTGLTLANVQQILSRSLRRMRAELDSYAASGPRPTRPAAATASRQRPDPA